MKLKSYPLMYEGRAFGWHMGAPEPTDQNLRLFIPAKALASFVDYMVGQVLDQGVEPTCTGACGTYWGIATPIVDLWGPEMIRRIYDLEKLIDADPEPGSTIHTLVKALGYGIPTVPGLQRLKTAAFAWTLADVDQFMLSGLGGVMFGMPWYQDMMHVWDDGLVHPSGRVVGGHAVFCRGTNRETRRRRFMQSWGLSPEFPIGQFEIADDDLNYLWSQGVEAAAAVELPLPGQPDPPAPIRPIPPIPPLPEGCLPVRSGR